MAAGWRLLRLLLRGELLLHLGGDGVGVHLVGGGRILEDGGRIAARGRQQDARLDQQPGERTFIGAAKEGGERLCHASIVALLPDAMLPRQHLDAVLVHDAYQLLKDEKQVTLHQANRNGGADSGEDTEAGRVGDGLFLALLLLLGLPLLIVAAGLLLRMMDRAGWIGAHLMDGANVAAFGDDGLGGELAHLELRPLGVVLRLRLVVPNRGVLVARQYRAAFFLCAVGGADLHQLRFRGDGLGDVRRDLGLIAGGVGAAVALPSEVIAKQQLVVACPLGAIGTTASGGDKLRVALVERRIFQDEQDIRCQSRIAGCGRAAGYALASMLLLYTSLKQALSAGSCWSAGSFASSSAWPTPISSA